MPSADADIVRQCGLYVEQGVPDVVRRFRQSVQSSVEATLLRPQAGAAKQVRNPALAGLRAWPVKGFDEMLVYCLTRRDVLMIIRVLHDKRDIGAILAKQTIENPDTDTEID